MIILDTNVVSRLMRPEPEYKVVAWVQEQADQELYTTALTKSGTPLWVGHLANWQAPERNDK